MSARLKSGIWVAALLRRAETQGSFGSVLFKGHEDAGQIYVVFARPGGLMDVLAPPPGPSINDDGDRRFEIVFDHPQTWAEVKAWLDKKRRQDSDIWAVEIEAREGFCGLAPEKKT